MQGLLERVSERLAPAGGSVPSDPAKAVSVLPEITASAHAALPADSKTAPGALEESSKAQSSAGATCSPEATLADLAQLLLSTGHSAAEVRSESQFTRSISEQDILLGYLKGTPWDLKVGEWLRGLGSEETTFDTGGRRRGQLDASTLAVARLGRPADLVKNFLRKEGQEGNSFVANAAVSQIMEPVNSLPVCDHCCTLQELLQALLRSPSGAALVTDGRSLLGLCRAADVLWAFCQRVDLGEKMWKRLAGRCDLHGLSCHAIAADTPLQSAALAMVQASEARAVSDGLLPHLLAYQPGGKALVGVLSPQQLLSSVPARLFAPPEMEPHQLETPKAWLQHHPTTVGDVVAQRKTPFCFANESLGEACDDLAKSGRTAAIVLDATNGAMRGVLTENDILQAFVNGESWDCLIDSWLRGDDARMPGFVLPVLTLASHANLAEAASCMACMAETRAPPGFPAFACHHLLVRGHFDAEDRCHFRLLSALDIALGLTTIAAPWLAAEGLAGELGTPPVVSQAMKPRGLAVTCTAEDSLADAFWALADSLQNCALVAGEEDFGEALVLQAGESGEAGGQLLKGPAGVAICGVVTVADVVRAVSIHEAGKCSHTSLGCWLLGQGISPCGRSIAAESSLAAAALAMVQRGVHHLLVVGGLSGEVLGVISALDIVVAMDKWLSERSHLTQGASALESVVESLEL
ncbi:unnamed protein product [Polarella glacialis]|uniref:CBS domain-containing protein n=1 Tax=Polarella glacialis TaxID=89957 RepID=A0A813EN84_POLGL|nr:unnamed protein product [Polarella glacialis]